MREGEWGRRVDPRLNNPGGGGVIGNADLLDTLTAFQLRSTSPARHAGLDLSQFGIDWDPFGFAGNMFSSSYFDPTPKGFFGTLLPAVGSSRFSIGADQFGSPATVQSVVINDGSAQRSMVTSLTVSFSTVVTLAPGAFELVRQEGGETELQVAQAVVDGRSVDTLTFSGSGIIGGSLADGHYTLTIHGDRVHDGFGQALDGAGAGVAGSDGTDAFFRLFGDSDGDGHLDLQDVLRFASTVGIRAGDAGYLWYFDYNGDGRVDLGDLFQLLKRLGRRSSRRNPAGTPARCCAASYRGRTTEWNRRSRNGSKGSRSSRGMIGPPCGFPHGQFFVRRSSQGHPGFPTVGASDEIVQ